MVEDRVKNILEGGGGRGRLVEERLIGVLEELRALTISSYSSSVSASGDSPVLARLASIWVICGWISELEIIPASLACFF